MRYLATRSLLPILASFAASVTPQGSPAASPIDPGDPPALVEHWAPVIYHDKDADTPRDDYLTKFDFDGDWVAENNRTNMDSGIYPLTAYVYYSIIETVTHYYLTYTFFHPYDSSGIFAAPQQGLCITHVNDVEGVTLTIQKDGSPFGRFRVMATEAHGDVFYFKPAASDVTIGGSYTEADSTAYFPNQTDEVAVFIEADGHGVGSQHLAMIASGSGVVTLGGQLYDFQGADGLIYYYDGGAAEEPAGAAVDSVRYELISLDELWSRRHNTGGEAPYCIFVNFVGNRGCRLDNLAVSFGGVCSPFGSCAANPPWGWDSDASGSPVGEWFLDPAYVVAFKHLADLPERTDAGFGDYLSNTFLQGDKSIEVQAPTGSAGWKVGDNVSIEWTHSDGGQGPVLTGTVEITLSRDGDPWETIGSGVSLAQGAYNWLVTEPPAQNCCIRLAAATDCVLEVSARSESFAIDPGTVAVAGPGRSLHRLHPPHPNPFLHTTAVFFELGEAAPVQLRILDAAGRIVRVLVAGNRLEAGLHGYVWDGLDQSHRAVPAGNYFLQLESGEVRQTERLIYVK